MGQETNAFRTVAAKTLDEMDRPLNIPTLWSGVTICGLSHDYLLMSPQRACFKVDAGGGEVRGVSCPQRPMTTLRRVTGALGRFALWTTRGLVATVAQMSGLELDPDDIVGAPEIADRSGIHPEYSETWGGRESFPGPVAKLEIRKLWLWLDVEAWIGREPH